MQPLRLGIIGSGRAAWAFATSWQQASLPLIGIVSRDASRPIHSFNHARVEESTLLEQSDAILLAVSDDALPQLASRLAEVAPQSTLLFHASGLLPAALFATHEFSASIHPLLSLPRVGDPVALSGVVATVEGNDDAVAIATQLSSAIGLRPIRIDGQAKPLYHAAAVIGSNLVALLCSISEDLISRNPEIAASDVAELARSAIANWESTTGNARFTGPAARGDAETIRQHLAALREKPETRELYAALSRELARRTGDASDKRLIELF